MPRFEAPFSTGYDAEGYPVGPTSPALGYPQPGAVYPEHLEQPMADPAYGVINNIADSTVDAYLGQHPFIK